MLHAIRVLSTYALNMTDIQAKPAHSIVHFHTGAFMGRIDEHPNRGALSHLVQPSQKLPFLRAERDEPLGPRDEVARLDRKSVV